MKGKIAKNAIESIVNALSSKNSKENKKYSRNKLLKSLPFLASGGALHYVESKGLTPIEVMEFFNNYSIDPTITYMGLYAVGSAFLLSSGDGEMPIQEELAQYGSEYCPYESFTVSNNDLKAKSIQMKINNLHNLSYKLGNKTLFGKITKNIAEGSEYLTKSAGKKTKKLLDFFGKGEFGFELIDHTNNNPRLINELPIPAALKQVLSPSTLDLDNQYKAEERKLVLEIRERAMIKSKEDIIERNVVLALVKIIDREKLEELELSDLKTLEKIKRLDKDTSSGNMQKYSLIANLANEFGKEGDVLLDFIKDLPIKNWNKDQSKHERAFNILNFLNQYSIKNKNENLKLPMTYKEIYRNNLVMATQFKLRSKFELENQEIQNKAPLIKEHYINTHKNYYRELSKFRSTKLNGTKLEEYPAIYFLEENELDNNIENTNKRKIGG